MKITADELNKTLISMSRKKTPGYNEFTIELYHGQLSVMEYLIYSIKLVMKESARICGRLVLCE